MSDKYNNNNNICNKQKLSPIAIKRKINISRGHCLYNGLECKCIKYKPDKCMQCKMCGHGKIWHARPDEMINNIHRDENIKLSEQLNELLSKIMKYKFELEEQKEKLLCSICNEKTCNMIILKCGHAKFCDICLIRWKTTNPICSICRQQITKTMKFIL
jgi:hypothetical protein